MSEGFAATYAKAVDDLAGKIFIPGLIASLLVEFGPWFQANNGFGPISTYIVAVFSGFLISGTIIGLLMFGSIYLYEGRDIAPMVAISIMPLGFAGMFPQYFVTFPVPFSQVTGVALLAWSFILLSKGSFGAAEERNL